MYIELMMLCVASSYLGSPHFYSGLWFFFFLKNFSVDFYWAMLGESVTVRHGHFMFIVTTILTFHVDVVWPLILTHHC